MKKDKKEKKQRKTVKQHFSDLGNSVFMLKQVAKYSPEFLFLTLLERSIYGISYGLLSAVMIKILYDRLEAGISFWSVASVILLMILIATLRSLYSHMYGWSLKQRLRIKVHKGMHGALYQKAHALDMACYDDPKFYNDFVWALNDSDARAMAIVEDMGSLIQQLISSLTTLGVMLSIDPIIVVIACINAIVNTYINLFFSKLSKKQNEEAIPHNRETDYVDRAMTLPDYAKEMRIGHASELVREQYERSVSERIKISLKYGRKRFAAWFFSDFFYSGSQGAIYIYLVWRLFSGRISLGGYAAASTAIWNLFWGFSNISRQYTTFIEHGMFAEKYRTFVSYEPKIVSGGESVPQIDEISFKNVTFRYPQTETDSLKNVSFSIKKGEKVAIVGYNGAGKTTLIKLLLRLYDPSDGEIDINGIDIRSLSLEDYRDKYGTVFQDFQIFAATIAENVIAGEYTEDMEERVLTALKQSTFDDKLATLKDGINTPLTREFDDNGVNLSGGEAQKIAIARVFAHNGEVIVMDEPSSALDPMSEYRLNQTILSYAKDKSVIFISHRLSTTRMADRILMFADGELIEDGSHEELMRMDGKYAEMFNMQAEKYTSKP